MFCNYLAPRSGLRGIVCQPVCLCVSVCPADILLFYFSAISRDIDLKFIQDIYSVVFNSLKQIEKWRHKNMSIFDPNSHTKIINSHTIVNKNQNNMPVIQPSPTHILYQCAKFGDDRTSLNVILDVCDV